ncbi:MAG: hypothetical protein JWR09_5661 [Mucilaginibacter sp.]|nr:hypothetical protein [Mucilaginibacter sp.]
MKKLLYFLAILFYFTIGCQNKGVIYDYQNNLESFIKNSCHYDLKSTEKNTVILILQNEDCICTKDDIALAKGVISSSMYNSYNFIIIVSSSKHLFLKEIPRIDSRRLKIIINDKNQLIDNGYIAVTDRVIIYNKGISKYFADMHMTPTQKIKKEIL